MSPSHNNMHISIFPDLGPKEAAAKEESAYLCPFALADVNFTFSLLSLSLSLPPSSCLLQEVSCQPDSPLSLPRKSCDTSTDHPLALLTNDEDTASGLSILHIRLGQCRPAKCGQARRPDARVRPIGRSFLPQHQASSATLGPEASSDTGHPCSEHPRAAVAVSSEGAANIGPAAPSAQSHCTSSPASCSRVQSCPSPSQAECAIRNSTSKCCTKTNFATVSLYRVTRATRTSSVSSS